MGLNQIAKGAVSPRTWFKFFNAIVICAAMSDNVQTRPVPDAPCWRAVRQLEARSNLCAVGFYVLNFYTDRNDGISWDCPLSERAVSGDTLHRCGAGRTPQFFEVLGNYDIGVD